MLICTLIVFFCTYNTQLGYKTVIYRPRDLKSSLLQPSGVHLVLLLVTSVCVCACIKKEIINIIAKKKELTYHNRHLCNPTCH